MTFTLVDFLPKLTLLGGQSFLWRQIDENTWLSFHSSAVIEVKREKNRFVARILWQSKELDLQNYFTDDNTYAKQVSRLLAKDAKLQKPVKALYGLRVLKQPLSDTLLTFALSSNNNIKRIRNLAFDLAQVYGKCVKTPYGNVKLFPEASVLANLTPEKLKEQVTVGYRADYLIEASKELIYNENVLTRLVDMDFINRVMQIKGVGPKVADCVAVFSGKTASVTPMDLWAKRIVYDLYGVEFKGKDEHREFCANKWGQHSALAGQFLFEYYRKK